MTDSTNVPAKRRGRGRPKKTELAKASNPGKVGRPKGTAGIIKEYTTRMLASPKSELVLKKVLDTALDDDHPHQAACMKMVMDRVVPVSGITAELEKSGGKPQISINITGMKDVSVAGSTVNVEAEDGEVIDGEVHEH